MIHLLPQIHAKAIFDCIKYEGASKLLEDYFRIRCGKINLDDTRIKSAYNEVLTQVKIDYYSDINDGDYRDEAYINEKYSLSYGELFDSV